MASRIKTNEIAAYSGGTVDVTSTLNLASGSAITSESGAGAANFALCSSVTFAVNSISGNAISGGDADCNLAYSGAAKVTPSATGITVAGDITGVANIPASTLVNAPTIQAAGKSVVTFAPFAFAAFKMNVTLATNVVTLASLAVFTTGSGYNVDITGSSSTSSNVLTLYYDTAAASPWADASKAMVNLSLSGLAGVAKLLDYDVQRFNDRVVITFLTQSGISDIGPLEIDGDIVVMVPKL
jgi:hypothetical protein